MTWLLVGSISLLVASLVLFVVSRSLRRRAGLPRGRVVYSDTSRWQECPEPLYASSVNLTGKPDYLVKRWNYVIPVEVKSCAAPDEPYRSHVLQLAAYCLLVEEVYERRPPFGLIHYPDRTFSVPYTPEVENEVLDTIEWMRQDLRDKQADRSHNDRVRCQGCGYATYCDQRLV